MDVNCSDISGPIVETSGCKNKLVAIKSGTMIYDNEFHCILGEVCVFQFLYSLGFGTFIINLKLETIVFLIFKFYLLTVITILLKNLLNIYNYRQCSFKAIFPTLPVLNLSTPLLANKPCIFPHGNGCRITR